MTKQIISLSENAANKIKEIMSKAQKDSIGVRVGVKSGGCAGMSYVMEYAKEIQPHDEVIEDKGVKVFIDSGAIMYLLGTEMDYKKEKFSSSFVFKNPNETERCFTGSKGGSSPSHWYPLGSSSGKGIAILILVPAWLN